MNLKTSKMRALGLLLASVCAIRGARCSPLMFEPNAAMPMPLGLPFVMAPQPFDGSQAQAAIQYPQFVLAPQFGFEADRRSMAKQQRPASPRPSSASGEGDGDAKDADSADSDERKAMDELPLSFLEPEPPSSLSERVSDTFSAIGEGVRNHLRSISENFSDTFDDIRDAWRFGPQDAGGAGGAKDGGRKQRG